MPYARHVSKLDAWLRRFLRSFAIVLTGVALILATAFLLFWSEDAVAMAFAMMADDPAFNLLQIWSIRIGGTLALVVGFGLLTSPLRVLAGIVPVFGAIVRFGTGIAAIGGGLGFATLILAFAWVRFQPWMALAVLLGGSVLTGILVNLAIYVGVRIANAREKATAAQA